jgi:hypothetical protein
MLSSVATTPVKKIGKEGIRRTSGRLEIKKKFLEEF